MQRLFKRHHRQGFALVTIMLDDLSPGSPATPEFAAAWREQYGLGYPVVADAGDPEVTMPYFMQGGLPLNMIVDGQTMQILFKMEGFDKDFLDSMVDQAIEAANH